MGATNIYFDWLMVRLYLILKPDKFPEESIVSISMDYSDEKGDWI